MRALLRDPATLAPAAVLALLTLLAVTSIGLGPLPGWWHHDPAAAADVVDGGRMTLDLLPPAVDGDGLAVGDHPLGQDDVGRDYFALTMRGTQRSLLVAAIAALLSSVVGAAVGLVSGLLGGRTDALLAQLTETVLVLPVLVVAAVLARAGDGGAPGLGLLIGLLAWPVPARLVRAETRSLRGREFVVASRVLGAGPWWTLRRHVLPQVAGTVAVCAALTASAAVLLETALGFVGLGVRSPDTSLGVLVDSYQRSVLVRPWLFWWPAAVTLLVALCTNLVGDGLRDALDPRAARRGDR